MSDYNLLPCPFCGEEAKIVDQFYVAARYVICKGCGSMTRWCETDKEVISAWNTRAQLSRQKGE